MQILTNFVVALASEAKPIIKRFRLKRCEEARGVTLFARDNIRLIVSGIGKAASATAVGYVAGSELHDTIHIWLNVGIAGHQTLAPGSVGMAHVITDRATGIAYYPSLVFRTPCPSYALECFDEPTTTYAGDAMCDMESSAFFSAAARFSSVEFVHALKIISDNSAADIATLDRASISALVETSLDNIEFVTDTLSRLAAEHLFATVLPSDALLVRWRFSATQKHQLAALARRWAALRPHDEWPGDALQSCHDARAVLSRIGTIVDSSAPWLEPTGEK